MLTHKAGYFPRKGMFPMFLAGAIALYGCREDPPDADYWEEAAAESVEMRDEIVPGDFAELRRGDRLPGSDTIGWIGEPGGVGELRGYVVCNLGVEVCERTALPDETVYTYILEITPPERTSLFRTALPVPGFTGVAGFDREQARDAIGDSSITVMCVDGALVWGIVGEEGWKGGKPITLYWESTSPPAGTNGRFQLISEGRIVPAAGLFPSGEGEAECI